MKGSGGGGGGRKEEEGGGSNKVVISRSHTGAGADVVTEYIPDHVPLFAGGSGYKALAVLKVRRRRRRRSCESYKLKGPYNDVANNDLRV